MTVGPRQGGSTADVSGRTGGSAEEVRPEDQSCSCGLPLPMDQPWAGWIGKPCGANGRESMRPPLDVAVDGTLVDRCVAVGC